MIPTLVLIKDGFPESITICVDQADVEKLFIEENLNYGRETNSDEIDDGYVTLEDVTICICWAEESKNIKNNV